MDGFERRRQHKKDSILNAALVLFKQYGYNKVSVNDIANKASVSPVSIYNFFGSKENLKNQLIETLWSSHFETIMSILKSNDKVQNKIEKFFFTVADYPRNCSMNFLAKSIRNQIKSEEDIVTIQLKKIDDLLLSVLEQGKAEGIINNNISTEAVLGYIEMFRYYFINNTDAAAKCDNDPGFLKDMISLYLNALFT
ncbi:TetR/AcrR family transcriptional regulator [Clostridium oryzae]|uniref:HTH-type transcriptional repressor Bm3R1 n=1 Tax=Clostridium oryzae TaxID=1450648 RepID=A0A1V4IEF8_9CLOT|nr:TetR/AcrR family transcriptional regulator [Clostridium oryzae]OPJ58361.1 HTH-type transcriptional repressor Bm3R1 [Clostridium oryzae]